MADQLARGLFANFAPDENPFGVPNGMEENLRALDDHLALYTMQAPIPASNPLPDDPSPGDGQIFTDGTYAVFNGGAWKTYPARRGIRAVLAAGTESWLNTGATWEQYSVVDTGPAVAQANAAAAEAESARDEAIAARDATNTSGKVFTAIEGISGGLAATSDGQNFDVISTDLLSFTRYRNNAGSALPLTSGYTKAFFDTFGMKVRYDRSGYYIAWLDAASRMALGVDDAGRVIFGNGGDIAARLATAESTLNGLPTRNDPAYDRSGYYCAIVDAEGKIALGVDETGAVYLGSALVPDITGRLDAIEPWIESNNTLAAWGDSLTQYAVGSGTAWPEQLATLLGRAVANKGVGGQQSTPIACRFGAIPTSVTVTGGQIPASGAVAVTLTLPNTEQAYANEQGGATLLGSLANVPGTLTRLGDGTFTFTRTTAGAVKTVLPGTPFVVDPQGYDFGTSILWVGANNIAASSTFGDVVIADTTAMVNYMKPLKKRFVVMSVHIASSSSNWPGTVPYVQMTRINDYLKTTWPGNFLDIRKILVEAYNPDDPQDVIDHSNDMVPTSLRIDAIHLNEAGRTVVANALYEFITEKGW